MSQTIKGKEQKMNRLNLSALADGTNPQIHGRKLSYGTASDLFTNQEDDRKKSARSKNKMNSHYQRQKTPNLGFVDAKESFKRDRDAVLFSEEAEEEGDMMLKVKNQNSFFEDMQRSFREEKSSEKSDEIPMAKGLSLNVPKSQNDREALALVSQKSSDGGPFERNINYEELLRQNP